MGTPEIWERLLGAGKKRLRQLRRVEKSWDSPETCFLGGKCACGSYYRPEKALLDTRDRFLDTRGGLLDTRGRFLDTKPRF